MHALAERKENKKEIGQQGVQHQHESVARKNNIVGEFRSERKQADEILAIVFHGELFIKIDPPGPIHLAAEDDDQKEQDEQVVIFGYGKFLNRR